MTAPLRKDAALNRARLLTAARELFAAEGPGVSLNEVAHRAGVGVGTAYRRFANRQELIEVLFEEALDDVEEIAREALAEEDAWDGLVHFLERSLELQFGDAGLNALMNDPALGAERAVQARTRIAPLLDELATAAKGQGRVRPDLEQSDLVFLQDGLAAIMQRSRAVEPGLYRRYLTIFLDGVRADRSFTTLPVHALDATRTHEATTSERAETDPA